MQRSVSPIDEYGELRLKRFFVLLGKGLFRVEACRAAQIDPGKIDRWLRAGDKGKDPYVEFARQVRRAEANLVEVELQKIRSDDDYRAHTWFMERRFPKQWGSVGDGDIEHTTEQTDGLRDRLRERLEAILDQRNTAAGDS